MRQRVAIFVLGRGVDRGVDDVAGVEGGVGLVDELRDLLVQLASLLGLQRDKARSLGLTPLARIVASAVSGLAPEIMGVGPIEACRKVLAQAGMSIGDIDVVELNEAFAAQVVPCRDELGIDSEKLNPFGGAIALGHPFGMTGARIMTTLLNDLETLDKTYGIESMCVAGGMGMAMLVERLN